MRWFRIRKADIDEEWRKTFEQYGVLSIQVVLALGGNIKHKGERIAIDIGMMEPIQLWLTEQYDRAERKETWSMTMEIAITIFVALEAVPMIHGFVCWLAARL
jgi:hypothetical protein